MHLPARLSASQLGGTFSVTNAVNAAGQVVGDGFTAGDARCTRRSGNLAGRVSQVGTRRLNVRALLFAQTASRSARQWAEKLLRPSAGLCVRYVVRHSWQILPSDSACP